MLVVHAPVRTADLGGWTDTWFAETGVVCNVAIEPGIEVRIADASFGGGAAGDLVELVVGTQTATGRRGTPAQWPDPYLGALLAFAPDRTRIEIVSGVAPGSGLGTSAAVGVAMLAAFDAWAGRPIDALAAARRAHAIETGLGRESGVQDHGAAALGGVRLWGITYPAFDAEAAIADSGVLDALTRRLHTLYLGAPHDSSALHRRVHGRLSTTDPTDRALLDPLRDAARLGFAALARGDLGAYGVQMVANHEAQRRLDPELISDLADHVVAVAALAGARGWKVNGAGGNGGSLAILGPDDDRADADLIAAVAAVEGVEVLAARVAGDGVRIVSR